MAGSTMLDEKSEWPENFEEDCEVDGLGTYAYCLHCGRPDDKELFYKDQETRDRIKLLTTQ